jgi:membrane-anchored protein YejM (alkaline phosphatase superfamily)
VQKLLAGNKISIPYEVEVNDWSKPVYVAFPFQYNGRVRVYDLSGFPRVFNRSVYSQIKIPETVVQSSASSKVTKAESTRFSTYEDSSRPISSVIQQSDWESNDDNESQHQPSGISLDIPESRQAEGEAQSEWSPTASVKANAVDGAAGISQRFQNSKIQ